MNRFGKVLTAFMICAILYSLIRAALGIIVPSPGSQVGFVLVWTIVASFLFVLTGPWNFEHVDEEKEITQFLQETLNARRIN